MGEVLRLLLVAAFLLSTTTASAPIGDAPILMRRPAAIVLDPGKSVDPLLAEERYELADASVRSLSELAGPGCAEVSGEADAHGIPAAEAMSDLSFVPITQACCRICSTGKACGNTCISRSFTCRQGRGCACDAVEYVPPPPPPPSISISRQSAYPRIAVGGTADLSIEMTVFFANWASGEVEMRITNAGEIGAGLRGWDAQGLIALNRSSSLYSHTFRAVVQGLAPGVHRVRVGFFHRTLGRVGPDGVYWDVSVDAIPNVSRLEEGWHSRWVTQSPYLTMRPGDVAAFWIRYANTGTETWNRGVWGRQVNLALNGDDKTPYRLGMAVNWLWDDRIATTQASSVLPGQVAEFRFSVRAPMARGVYFLNLRPVVDGTTWLEDEGVFWVVEVR